MFADSRKVLPALIAFSAQSGLLKAMIPLESQNLLLMGCRRRVKLLSVGLTEERLLALVLPAVQGRKMPQISRFVDQTVVFRADEVQLSFEAFALPGGFLLLGLASR